MSTPISQGAEVSRGITTAQTAPAASETASGRAAPARSDSRPASGDSPDSTSAPHRNVTAITVPDTPSLDSRSGASTSSMPKAIPASAMSQQPMKTSRSRSAGSAARSGCGAWGRGEGTVNATTISSTSATEAAENAAPVPTALATAPTTGPNRAPTTAAPSAAPSNSPRRASGAVVASQDSAAVHVQAPPSPWTRRAASSSPADGLQPKARVDPPISASPSTATVRSPNRATSAPLGSDPSSVPAGYAAISTPAEALDNPAAAT